MATQGSAPAPRGVPSVTYMRILSAASGSSDIINDGNTISVFEPNQPTTRHEVAQVLDRGLSDLETCERTIGPMAGAGLGAALNPISAFVHDSANICLLNVGSRLTKKSQFLKKSMLPFIANELFVNLTDKEQDSRLDYYQYQLVLRSYEIQDEIITDLLRPSSRGLHVTLTAESGVIVPGIYSEQITDEFALKRSFAEACDNRCTYILPVGGSIDTSSAIFEIELTQTEGERGLTRQCVSRCFIVDVPAVDPLLVGVSDIRALESVTLHKSLCAFFDVCKKLSNPSKANLAPFRASCLTHVLSELLGGNAIVVMLGTLASGEPAVTRKTLELSSYLALATHYPIGGRELSDALQGLLCKYRALILQLTDEQAVVATKNGKRDGSEGDSETDKIQTLQLALANTRLELSTAKDDRAKIAELCELLKSKYANLLLEKQSQTKELIACEEDKLNVCQSLLSTKLKFCELQEDLEKQRFEKESEVLLLKSKLKEEIDKAMQCTVSLGELEIKQSSLELELQKLTSELQSTKAVNSELKQLLAAETNKNIELGTELLTLLNQKDSALRDASESNGKLAMANANIMHLEALLASKNELLSSLESDVRSKDDGIANLKHSLREATANLKNLQTTVDNLQQDGARSLAEFQRERELMLKEHAMEMLQLQQEEQAQRDRTYQQQVAKPTSESSSLMSEMELERAVRNATRAADRKLRDSSAIVARLDSELAAARSELHLRDTELSLFRERYRTNLKQALLPASASPPSVRGNGASSDQFFLNHPENNRNLTPDELLNELLQSFVMKETHVIREIKVCREHNARMRQFTQALIDRLRALIDNVEDHLQTSKAATATPDLAMIESNLLQSEDIVRRAEEEIASSLKWCDDSDSPRRVNEEISEQQRGMLLIASYKRALETAEAQLAMARKEMALHSASQVRDSIELRQSNSKPSLLLSKDDINLDRNSDANNSKIYSVADNEAYAIEPKLAVASLKPKELEQRVVLLESQNISLKEELKSYQTYMKETITDYSKQIRALKAQLQQRDGLTIPERPESDIRFPGIPTASKRVTSRPTSGEVGSKDLQSKLPQIS